MDDISKLYDEVMAGATEKIAEDMSQEEGPEFNDLFTKLAEGDEEATAEVEAFIAEAQAQGASDEEIEEALVEAMSAEGAEGGDYYGDPEMDEFEEAKLSAYVEGSERAIADMLESDMAKEAGVTADDLVEFELGGAYGTGYAETRMQLEEAIEKIAAGKEPGKIRQALSNAMRRVGQYHRTGAQQVAGAFRRQTVKEPTTGMRNVGNRAAVLGKGLAHFLPHAAVAGGGGYAGYRALKKRKAKKGK